MLLYIEANIFYYNSKMRIYIINKVHLAPDRVNLAISALWNKKFISSKQLQINSVGRCWVHILCLAWQIKGKQSVSLSTSSTCSTGIAIM